jgi:lipopolysaccharide transport system permease protein
VASALPAGLPIEGRRFMNGFSLPRRLVHRRDLLRELLARDMKMRYKRSHLGVAWTLMNPLAQLLVYNFVFRVLFRVDTPHYMIHIFIGITSWTWFQSAVVESATSIVQSKDLIRQPGFPAALLPNVTVGSHLIHFLLTLPVLLGLMLVDGVPVTPAILWLPVVILLQYVLILSLSLLVAGVHVQFRDTQYLLGVFLMLGFFLSPVLYDVSIVPERYRPFYMLNPMTHIIGAYRAVIIEGHLPALMPLAVVAACSTVLLGLTSRVFRHASRGFVEEL